jgi:DNA topoisomerase II
MRNARFVVRSALGCEVDTDGEQQWQLADMQRELDRLSNQARFVQMIIDNQLTISKKKKPVLMAELRKLGFKAYVTMQEAKKAGEEEEAIQESESEEDAAIGARDYDYLLGVRYVCFSFSY